MPDYNNLSFWGDEEAAFWDAIGPLAVQVYHEGGEAGVNTLPDGVGIAVNWDTYNRGAVDWLKQYRLHTVRGIMDTTRDSAVTMIDEWVRSGDALPVLISQMETLFSANRAAMIAVTEVTRMYAEGNIAAWDATGMVGGNTWQTAVDELVCPICGPLHGMTVELNSNGFTTESGIGLNAPPAHPRCRCWLTPVVDEALFREQIAGDLGQGGGNVPQFQTVREAEEWFKGHNMGVDFTGANLEQIQAIAQSLDDVSARLNYRVPVDNIRFVNSDYRFVGRYDPYQKTLIFDRKGFVDDQIELLAKTNRKNISRIEGKLLNPNLSADEVEYLNKRLEMYKSRGVTRFGVSETLADISNHEIGHAIELDLTYNERIPEFANPSRLRELGIDFKDSWHYKLEKISHSGGGLRLSEYATTNGSEYFAEAWAAFMKGETKLINKELLDLFEQIIK